MLNRLIAFVLLITLLTANLSRFLLYAGFHLKRDYIAAVLCENKDQPLKNCKGRCYLMKKLKAVEEKERKQSREAQKNSYQEAMKQEPFAISFRIPFQTGLKYPVVEVADPVRRSASIFQPPQVI
ncbi:hypothetical protein C7T94_14735 [Pedobacter yulinensis]|uniref:Uncharacterized protein n=1 Tax=Pedobacter yulinensis TaxID=2126353 RepID=A0A2T3HHZ7_9SPHI|nr:hypothetical protein [Pedobacter yulinensis]PST82065.1 hypothetical protein C7T94_14735 [Pedobacter yulinensis]